VKDFEEPKSSTYSFCHHAYRLEQLLRFNVSGCDIELLFSVCDMGLLFCFVIPHEVGVGLAECA